jgi:iron complex transport system substrate-binding protein
MRGMIRIALCRGVLAAFAALIVSPVNAQPRAASSERIVTLGGAITETVFALGAGAQIVGVDKSSTYPIAAQRLPNVGYFRQAGAEGILALRPTLVLADTGVAATTIAQLRTANTRVVVLPAGESVAITLSRIAGVGRAINRQPQADSLGRAVTAAVQRATRLVARSTTSRRALVIYARGVGTLFVAGSHTGADEMLRLAGARNVGSAFAGYKPLTAEAVAASNAEVIVLPTNGLRSLGGIDAVLALPGVSQTPAGAARRIVTVDDALLLGFGPRVAEGIEALARAVQPALRAAATVSPPTR